jgi:methanogenic corrinoid protein MtbC1
MTDEASTLARIAQQYVQLTLAAERLDAIDLVLHAADRFPLEDIYLRILQVAQYEIGRLWEAGDISVAQEHYCTAVTQLIMSKLFSRVSLTPKNGRTFLGTCTEGELHEAGIRMVCDLFELRGWKSIYLGSASELPLILQAVHEQRPDVIGISIAREASLPMLRKMIDEMRVSIPRTTPVLVGGRPFIAQPELWKGVGADGTADDAAEAVVLAATLLGDFGSST